MDDGERCHRSPGTAQAKAVVFAAAFELHVPAFIGSGENVAADDSYGCAGNYIVGIMVSRFHAAVSHERRECISGYAVFPAIPLAHKLRGGKRERCVR